MISIFGFRPININGIDLKGSVKQNDGSWKSMNFLVLRFRGVVQKLFKAKKNRCKELRQRIF